jgi:hypothetical protein
MKRNKNSEPLRTGKFLKKRAQAPAFLLRQIFYTINSRLGGYSAVIPAKAGIQFHAARLRSGFPPSRE